MRIDNMEKVFKAAMTLFSKQNVTNTTLQMIADEAGVSTRSIVNYFNTRENLCCVCIIMNYPQPIIM